MNNVVVQQKNLGLKGLLFFLILSNMFVPFSTDMYLPALPAMSDYFNSGLSVTNLTLSAFFFFYGCGILIWGPLSDKYGRRPCLLTGASMYAMAGIGCFLAGNIYLLIFCRILQGMGTGGITTLSMAIVKDCFSGSRRETILAVISTLSGIGPVIGPLAGALIIKYAGWKWVFAILAGVGIVALILALLFQETLPVKERYTGSFINTMGMLFVVMKNRSFLWPVVIFSLNNLPFMGYIAVSSYIYEDFFHLSGQMYSLYFAANACAFLLGPILYIRFFRYFDKNILVKGNFFCCVLIGVAIVLFGSFAPWLFWLSFLPFSILTSGIGPLATNLMMDQQKGDSGTAASLIKATSVFCGCLGTSIASIAWGNIIWGYGAILAVFSLISLVGWTVFMRLPIPCVGLKKAS